MLKTVPRLDLANRTNFGLLVKDLASPDFGYILDASSSRLVQVLFDFLF